MSENIKTGKRGEDLAADFLTYKGFEILRRNYKFRRAEIDIIARKEDWVIFVEVKTRSYSYYGYPEEFVDSAQAGRIFQAAEEFIYSTSWRGHIRFDIISVLLGENPEIVHFEDAIN
ncbi:MAG: YraN family protein [Chryseolinea sp.]